MRRAAATTRCLLSSRTYVSSPSPAPPPRPRPSRLLRRTGAKQRERARERESSLASSRLPPTMHHTDSRACTHERPSLAPPCMYQPPPARAAPMHLLDLAHAAASDDDDCCRRRRPQANGGAAVRTRRSTPSRSCSRCQAAPSASTPPRHPPRSWSAPPAWRVRPKRCTPPHTAAHRRTPPHTAAHCRTLPPPSTLCTLTGGARLTAARIALPSRLQCVYSASTVRAWCMAWLALLVPPPPRPQLAGPRCMWASPSPSPNPSQALALHENASKPSEDGRAPPPSNHSSQPAAAPPKRRTVRRPCPAAAARCCRHLCGCCRDPQPTPPPCRDRPPWVRASTAASTTAAKWTTPLLTTTRRRPS